MILDLVYTAGAFLDTQGHEQKVKKKCWTQNNIQEWAR